MKLAISPGCLNCFYLIKNNLWFVIDLSSCLCLKEPPYIQLVSNEYFKTYIIERFVHEKYASQIIDDLPYWAVTNERVTNSHSINALKNLSYRIKHKIGTYIKINISILDASLSFINNQKQVAELSSCCLSKREKEILQLISRGLSSKQVAEKLFICETTVITHRKNLLYKLEAKNTAELIRKGFEFNYILT